MEILNWVKKIFRGKRSAGYETLALLDSIKKFYSAFDYVEMQGQNPAFILLLYNGYPIGKAYDNIYTKEFNWQISATGIERSQIEDIYKKLDEIYER